jgi:hypothetical protein
MVSHLAIVRHRLHPKEHVAFSYLLPAVSEFLGMLYNKVEILKYLTEYYLGRSDRVSIHCFEEVLIYCSVYFIK